MRSIIKTFSLAGLLLMSTGFRWGFYAHQRINELAVFTLPPEMIGFYKEHRMYISQTAVNPDRRRYSVPEEAARHYIDLDHFGDSALYTMPRFWADAVALYTEDTLKAYGIAPWHIQRMYLRLRDAFLLRDPARILRVSSELGHYIADAHVPLHTTENYNGQLTGQHGIHGLWESRLPELYATDFDFFVGKAYYIANTQREAWKAVESAHLALDSVLFFEREVTARFGSRKHSFETRAKQTVRVYSREFSHAYYEKLSGMVERQMRAAILRVGSFWYTAWVDAGQPDLRALIGYEPTDEELKINRQQLDSLKSTQHRAWTDVDIE